MNYRDGLNRKQRRAMGAPINRIVRKVGGKEVMEVGKALGMLKSACGIAMKAQDYQHAVDNGMDIAIAYRTIEGIVSQWVKENGKNAQAPTAEGGGTVERSGKRAKTKTAPK